jgi:hypothetical protein
MNKIQKPFSLVNFYKEKKVAIVSTSWLDDSQENCYWPAGPGSEEKLLKNAAPENNWTKYPCNFLQSYSIHFSNIFSIV